MNIFLIILAAVWLLIASLQDLRKREVPNWLSFSLIIFALAYRAVYASIFSDWLFFVYGLLGLGVFIVLGYGLYYARVFAGGDAKLLMALGPVLAVSTSVSGNLIYLGVFLFIAMLVGGLYGLVWSFFLAFRKPRAFSREWKKQYQRYRSFFYIGIIFALISAVFPIYSGEIIFWLVPVIFLLSPLLFVYAKSVEESCMIVQVSSSELTEGDWLYSAVKVRGKIIKPNWEGLSYRELKLLKGCRGKIKIKIGIPFVPVFLIAFIALIILRKSIFII